MPAASQASKAADQGCPATSTTRDWLCGLQGNSRDKPAPASRASRQSSAGEHAPTVSNKQVRRGSTRAVRRAWWGAPWWGPEWIGMRSLSRQRCAQGCWPRDGPSGDTPPRSLGRSWAVDNGHMSLAFKPLAQGRTHSPSNDLDRHGNPCGDRRDWLLRSAALGWCLAAGASGLLSGCAGRDPASKRRAAETGAGSD